MDKPMEAGRELDAHIAETWFGYTLDYEFADLHIPPAPHVKELRDQYDEWGILPAYSSDIAAAWLIVESPRLTELFTNVEVSIIRFLNYYACQIEDDTGANCVTAHAPTAPLAICRAALEALNP